MKTSAHVLAVAVVLLHMAFVVFAVAGGLLALRWPRVSWVHLPAAAWAALISFAGWICPLTPLENWLRAQSGDVPYTGGFLEHYLLPILYPVALTRTLEIWIGVCVIALNVVVYWRVLRR